MAQKSAEFIDVVITPNPVNTGLNSIISVELRDFTHAYWSSYTHLQLKSYTHGELSNMATYADWADKTWAEVSNVKWG